MCTEYIQNHIRQLPSTQIFTTREMLQYGLRGTVDQALSRMVKADFIVRLARGVFVRDASLNPSLVDIVKAKMEAWNKVIFAHAENLLVEMQLIPAEAKVESIIAVNAHSSSFNTVQGRVNLKGIGSRRVQLCESLAGRVGYALWHLKKKVCTRVHVSEATKNFARTDRDVFRLATAMMPAWLSNLCQFRFSTPRVNAKSRY